MQEVQNLCEQHGIKYYPGSEVFLNRDYLDMIDAKLFLHWLIHVIYYVNSM